ncbi:MAG: diacylglycerol kinase family lipid kinase [Candidatus Dormibacteraeota bacterium]|nr:diacylglycerol kinase family lipid kinase [Candidatus Dormibacteraeota bacterium]
MNPASGAGRAGREWSALTPWLSTTGLPFEAKLTTRPGEATEIAQAAVRESRPAIVAVGGDGTLNEVVNGFFHNGAPIPTTSKLAMLPLGTGGDFRRTLRIPLDIKQAVHVISAGTPRRLDAGCVTYAAHDGSTAVRHFINIADAGLGGEVVYRVNKGSKRLGGAATFALTSGLTLLGWKNKPMTVVIDGNSLDLVAQQVVVANCQYFGGGMRMAPSAKPTDGVFDVVLWGDLGKLETARLMSSIREGTHLDQRNPKIQLLYGKRIAVSSSEPVRIDLDGEQAGMLPALFEIQPGAIEFIAPV